MSSHNKAISKSVKIYELEFDLSNIVLFNITFPCTAYIMFSLLKFYTNCQKYILLSIPVTIYHSTPLLGVALSPYNLICVSIF